MHVLHTPILAEASLHGLPQIVVEELTKIYFEENGSSKHPETLSDLLEVML